MAPDRFVESVNRMVKGEDGHGGGSFATKLFSGPELVAVNHVRHVREPSASPLRPARHRRPPAAAFPPPTARPPGTGGGRHGAARTVVIGALPTAAPHARPPARSDLHRRPPAVVRWATSVWAAPAELRQNNLGLFLPSYRLNGTRPSPPPP